MASITDEKDGDDGDDGMSGVADFVQIYLLSIDIIAGHDLEKADTFGKSDPFCKVSAFSTSYTTCTILKTLNPRWDEHLEMTFFNDPKKLKFEVWDWDKNTKSDAIGDCELAISDFYDPSNPGFSGRIKLRNCKSGELEVKVTARKLVPSELEHKIDTLQDTVEANTSTMATLDAENAQTAQQNTTLEAEMGELSKNITMLTAEIPQREQEQRDEEGKGEGLRTERMTLQTEQTRLEQEVRELDAQKQAAEKEVAQVQGELEQSRGECAALRKEIAELKQRIKDKREQEKRDREKAQAEADAKAEAEAKEREQEEAAKEKLSDIDVVASDKPNPGDVTTPLVDGRKGKDQTGDQCCCVVL